MKVIIEQNDDWKPGDCYPCRFTCAEKYGINPVCPMLGSKEVVEVDPEIQSVEIGLPVPEAPFKVMMVDNEQVTLYAVKGD